METKNKESKEEGTLLPCEHCKYQWRYKGKALYWTSCPRCKANVKVKK